MFTRNEFVRFCSDLSRRTQRQSEDYYEYHLKRLWAIYQVCARVLPNQGGTLVSVGAGSAYVEAALVASHSALGAVIDLPEVVAISRGYYDSCSLVPFGLDLSSGNPIALTEIPLADLVISSEIVEHLPSPPSRHFVTLRPLLRQSGTLLVATPNAGSLRSALKTLLHQPILPSAEQTFGPVNLENEGVHRREYMPIEIEAALTANGFELTSKHYVSPGSRDVRYLPFSAAEALVPYFRQGVIITAAIDPDDGVHTGRKQ
jgi:hypothetical protein